MAWIIAACSLVALGLAAFAGLGRFGEMPEHPVTDRPKGHVPPGPVTAALLAQLRLPRASTGYARASVDGYLANVAAGTAEPAETVRFPVERGGYDMQAVDELIERPRYERPFAAPVGTAAETSEAPPAPEAWEADPPEPRQGLGSPGEPA